MNEQAFFDALKYRIEDTEYGPDVEHANDAKFWYQNGQLHRTDGPAVEWADGSKEWYINYEGLTEDEFNQAVKEYV